MKLIQISDSTYYIPGATATGVVRSENRAIPIDTGLDKESGRRILRLIQKNGLDAAAIINTHSHADHFGGNSFIVRRTDAKVYAPAIEAGIIQYPYLEPLYLFSAHPVNEMMSRFLMALGALALNLWPRANSRIIRLMPATNSATKYGIRKAPPPFL